MKTIIANILATLILLGVYVIIIWYNLIDIVYQTILLIFIPVIVLFCWFEWQTQESGKFSVRMWMWLLVFSIAWTLLGPFIASVIYGVSYCGLLMFRADAWHNVGYMGILGMGPFFLIIALVSTIRGLILKLLQNDHPRVIHNIVVSQHNSIGESSLGNISNRSKFVPRKTPDWMNYFGIFVILPPLIIVWGSTAWIILDILRLNLLRGFVLLLIWLPIIWFVASVLHKRGLVRRAISLATTFLVVAIAAWVILSSSK